MLDAKAGQPAAGAAGGGTRRLLIVRHAKAVPKGETEDFDRALSDCGRADAPETGRWLADSGYTAELALCSPSRRPRQTWQLIQGALAAPPPALYDDRLYDAAPTTLVGVLAAHGGTLGSVLLVGHNTGLHELAVALCGHGPPDLMERLRARFPTSGVAVVDFPGGWDAIAAGDGTLKAFWSPADR
ncbi:histidine phosphatase family protein [Streptomyces sp. NPDC002138]|uniref:SixA phosphatase family protein n=1 Tax=Streptomyces sp. NPDC002138 TaxID=3154410 RepID=UPI00332514D3